MKALERISAARMGAQMDPFSAAPKATVWRLPHAASQENRLLLIADDDQRACQSAAHVLRLAGFDVLTAFSGSEVLRLADAARPGVAILDLSMPFGSGWDAASALRSEGAKMLLIAHTGFSAQAEWQRAKQCGFDAYFVKPCDYDRLIQLIKAYFWPAGKGACMTWSGSP
jgi:DNA-binding response OmpR family regulator